VRSSFLPFTIARMKTGLSWAGLLGTMAAGPAWAQVACEPACLARQDWHQAGTGFGTPPATSSPPEEPRVRIGHDAGTGGTPAYAVRESFSGSASIVTFSSRPVPVRRSRASARPSRSVAQTGARPGGGSGSGFGLRTHPILGGLRNHDGIDMAAPAGSPIVAGSDGVVSAAGWKGGYGLFVAMEHGGGLQTRYAHMSRLNVVAGQSVARGQVIGYVGSTGLSTGPHLHYELRVNGTAINPVANVRRQSGRP
jgi:murein DD-endopeptidase MepM/ murein hydrolase activator NlpD